MAVADLPSLKDRLICHLASSPAILKQQQLHEPDLTCDEKKEIASNILDKQPAQFLYRFGKYLEREHLQYFLEMCDDPEIEHHLQETQKYLNSHTNKVLLKNRRYGAMQSLLKGSSYFSETEMKKRNPLLYEQLVGQHLSEEERKGKSEETLKNVTNFATMLMHNIEQKDEKEVRIHQEELENCAIEENDTDSDSETEMEEPIAVESEKKILKEEFYSDLYNSFLLGRDEDFDYSQIDSPENNEMLRIRELDEEERYFEEDD